MNQKYIDMVYSENHLEHHGVLGQKWGVENGPPYPLGRDVQSMLSNGASYHSIKKAIRSDAKAAKKEAKAFRNEQKNDLRSRIDKEETRYQSSITNAENRNDKAWDKFADDVVKAKKDYKEAKKAGDENAKEKYKNTRNSLNSKIMDEEERFESSLKRTDDKNDEAWNKFSSDSKQIKSDYKNSIKDIESAKKAQMKELKNATNREGLNKALKIAGVAAGVAAVAGVSYLAAKEIGKKLDENDRADKGLTRAGLAKKLSYGEFKNDLGVHETSIRNRTNDIATADATNRKVQEADNTLRNVDYMHNVNEYNRRYTELGQAQRNYNNADYYAKKSTDKVLAEKAMIKGNANTPSKKLAASLMDKYDRTRLETANKNSSYTIYNPYYDKNVIKDRSKKSKR